MAKTISELKAQSQQVKSASVAGENTATRVGQLFGDIVDHVEAYEASQSNRDANQDATASGLVRAEETRAKAEENTLSNRITAEAASRDSGDRQLANEIAGERTTRATADENIKTALANETARAKAAEQALADAKVYTAKLVDGAVTTPKIANGAVTYEKTDIITQKLGTSATKVPSQAVVTSAIEAEETQRKADVTDLSSALDSEAKQREQADAVEAEARINDINKEATTRSQNDALLSQAITDETNRAKAAEEANTQAIAKRGIYDVSAYNGGAVFESLSALLNNANLSTLIPASVRCGGMSIRFIQGSVPNSDNKYVSYMLTKPTWSINIDYWTLVTNNWEAVSSEEKEIIILDDEDEELARINNNGVNFKNLKSNGKTVVTSDELEDYATEAELGNIQEIAEATQEKTENITNNITESDDEAIILATDKGQEVANLHAEIINDIEECQSWNSDDYDGNGEGEQYAKITPQGIHAKSFTRMDGTPININTNYLYAYSISGTDDATHFYGINAIKKALDSITDNSYYNRYIIHVKGRFIFTDVTNHTKNINKKNRVNTWWVNVYGKDYVTLDGGNKNSTSIEMYLSLDTVFPTWDDGVYNYYGGNYHVLFNNAIWFECKNITLIGHNTRYCVHQEDFNEIQPSHVLFENCVFKFKYDGIWTAQNTNLPSGSTILNGNTVLGCGYRIGGDINYINCDFISYSLPQYNTLLCGSHTGYRNGLIQEYLPAKITHKACSFDGFGARLVGYSSVSWQTKDELYFENCKINGLSQVQFGVTARDVYDNAKSTPRVFINHEPMPVINVSTGSQVLKVVAKSGNSSEIRLQSCSAYSIFGENTNDVKPRINEWGAYEYNGTIYKDDTNGLDGYLLGTQALAKKTLGVILGDCSTTNKTLIISLNGVNASYTFNADYTSASNSEIITILNAAFANLEFSIVGLSDYEYPTFNNVDLFINNGSVSAKRGMAVVITPNGFHVATSSERLDGICIDDTPIGQMGRIAKSGAFERNYIATDAVSFTAGSYYSFGSDAGKFVVNNEKKDNCLIALSNNVCQIKK